MDLFVSGLLLSLSLCLDLGIVNVAVMKTGVERGVLPAFLIGLGSGIGDLIYASLSLVGISLILQLQVVRWTFWLGGTLVLLYLTITMIRHSLTPRAVDADNVPKPEDPAWKDFLWGIGLALSSPSAILWFATVGGSVIASTSTESRTAFIVLLRRVLCCLEPLEHHPCNHLSSRWKSVGS